jgi:hypothetical protein
MDEASISTLCSLVLLMVGERDLESENDIWFDYWWILSVDTEKWEENIAGWWGWEWEALPIDAVLVSGLLRIEKKRE